MPPLEGFWWMDGAAGVDYANKAGFQWIAAIRLPDFVARCDLEWAQNEAARRKRDDFSPVTYLVLREGLCVQCLHTGPYDDEPATVARMEAYARSNGCVPDFTDTRRHHEIYLSDARRCAPDKLRTVIRHPVRRV